MITKQEEFIESLKALMVRYDVELMNDNLFLEGDRFCFMSKDGTINIRIEDIYYE